MPRSQGFLGSWIGLLLLFGWSVALFYHLCNGIRHLWWDTGRGLDLQSVYAGGWAVLGGDRVLTVAAWVAGIVALGRRWLNTDAASRDALAARPGDRARLGEGRGRALVGRSGSPRSRWCR